MVVSVKCHQLQGALPLTPGPYWGHSPHTPIVALHFGCRFVCGPILQLCNPDVQNYYQMQTEVNAVNILFHKEA